MKTIFWLVALLLFFSNEIFCQGVINKAYLDFKVVKNRDKDYYKTFRGSPYENPDFTDAFVYTNGYSTPQKAKMRYNTCFDEMEMIKEGKDEFQILSNNTAIDSIILNSELYKYLSYKNKDTKTTTGYLIQLYSGECNLFTKRPRAMQDEKIPASGYEEYTPPSIIIGPEIFFVQIDHGPVELLPTTSKKIVSFFQDKGYDLSGFLKTEKIKNDKESLMKIVHFCDK
jgi:hypothetical protein